jgi:hypothetical protein
MTPGGLRACISGGGCPRCASSQGQCDRRTAESNNEVPPSHAVTSSARVFRPPFLCVAIARLSSTITAALPNQFVNKITFRRFFSFALMPARPIRGRWTGYHVIGGDGMHEIGDEVSRQGQTYYLMGIERRRVDEPGEPAARFALFELWVSKCFVCQEPFLVDTPRFRRLREPARCCPRHRPPGRRVELVSAV